jgi:hypothetical protein
MIRRSLPKCECGKAVHLHVRDVYPLPAYRCGLCLCWHAESPQPTDSFPVCFIPDPALRIRLDTGGTAW